MEEMARSVVKQRVGFVGEAQPNPGTISFGSSEGRAFRLFSESMTGRTPCLNWARGGLWGAGGGNFPGLPGTEGGAGQDQRFWRLAQALSALYPSGSDEKRWVDGVMARKKSLGL